MRLYLMLYNNINSKNMETATLPTSSHPSKNNSMSKQWYHSQPSSKNDIFERSQSKDPMKKHQYMFVCLSLEKYAVMLSHSYRKIQMKNKRMGFRRILENSARSGAPKDWLRVPSASKRQGQMEQASNPQLSSPQVTNICLRSCELLLSKMVGMLEKAKIRQLASTLNNLRVFGQVSPADLNPSNYQRSSIYQTEISGKGASRMSNKRKKTKNNEDYKQNSHMSTVEISQQNQRLRMQMAQEEEEREVMFEQFSDMFDYHEKYLSQGSSTTRTKKNK